MDSNPTRRFSLLALSLLVLALGLSAASLQGAEPDKKAAAPPAPAVNAQTGAPASPANPAAAAKPAQPSKEQMMEAMMKLAQPGEHHKRLDSFAGRWKTTGKTWMEPGQPPADFSGTVESSWTLGGRYLQSVHKSEFGGMPFEGRSINGYDNATNEYFSTWIDNMGTGVMVFRGKCDDPCKALSETAEGFDPMAGKVMKTRTVTTPLDPDTYRFEMYMTGAAPDGGDVKIMELTARRAK